MRRIGATEAFVVRHVLSISYPAIRHAGDAFRFGITRSDVAR
jgi:hypothetical protein